MRTILFAGLVALAVGAVPGCSCDNSGMGTDDMDVTNADLFGDYDAFLASDMYIGVPSADGGIIITTDAGTFTCFITPCQGKLYQCGNCIDDDKDGLVDSQDPDCLGACQNNEAGFFGNIPGQNNAPCKSDCYWDQDTGSGNDKCEWDHECDPFQSMPPPAKTSPEIGCDYKPNTKFPGGESCADKLASQAPACTTFCKPLTPNGCDCFGCCENPRYMVAPNAAQFVYAGSQNAQGQGTCTGKNDTLDDPTKCKACTPVPGCKNACGKCQLCFGKTTLPPECFGVDGGVPGDGGIPPIPDGGIVGQCLNGEQPCGLPGQAVCPPGFYCVTGCCQDIIF
jgi:hypothetical protein